jgi:hypothetical protein
MALCPPLGAVFAPRAKDQVTYLLIVALQQGLYAAVATSAFD